MSLIENNECIVLAEKRSFQTLPNFAGESRPDADRRVEVAGTADPQRQPHQRRLRRLRHPRRDLRGRRLPRWPDGYNQTLRLYVFGPSGLKDYGSATLRCKI